jgi:hypothetical protein
MNTKKPSTQDENSGRVVDSERSRGDVETIAPDREDEQRHPTENPEDGVLLGQLAAAHELQHERKKRRAH